MRGIDSKETELRSHCKEQVYPSSAVAKLVVAAVSICLLLLPQMVQGATPGAPKWTDSQGHPTQFGTGGKVSGSPAISADGHSIYVTSEDGNLYRINASTGPSASDNWSARVNTSASYDNELVSSPVVATDGSIYVVATSALNSSIGYLYRVNPNGTTPFGWPFPLTLNNLGPLIGALAVATDGTVYVTYDDDSKLHAIDPTGPSVKWEFDLSQCAGMSDPLIESAPTVGPDGTVYFYVSDGNDPGIASLVAVDCAGDLKWTARLGFGEEVDDLQYAPVVDANGVIYVPYSATDGSSTAEGLLAINPDGTPKWKNAAGPLPFNTGGTIHSSPAIGSDGTLYFGSDDGHLYAVNGNGTLKWQHPPIGQAALQGIESSPALGSDGTIYFGCDDGRMRSITDNGTSATLQWTYTPTGLGGQLKKTRSSPAVGSDDAVYFGSDDDNVYAVYGSAPLANSTWPMFRRNVSHNASETTSATCSAPAWITPANGQSFNTACYCILLKVRAAAGSQVDFYELINGSPQHLNGGTAGSDNTYSFSWCNVPAGTHILYFVVSGGGGTVSSACTQPLTITVTTFTQFDCVNIQFSAIQYDGESGRAAAGSLNPDFDYRWNIIAGNSGADATGSYSVFDGEGNCTPVSLILGQEGTPTYVFTESPASSANDGLLRGGLTCPYYCGTLEIEMQNIPSGTYDLYLYGTGGTLNDWPWVGPETWCSSFELYYPGAGQNANPQPTSSSLGWDINTWVEGNQYVVFTGIQVTDGQMYVDIHPFGASGYEQPLINGLQLVWTGP